MSNHIVLDFDHWDADRVAFFLNSVNDTLQRVPFDWSDWEMQEEIVEGCRFIAVNTEVPLTITVLICASYQGGSKMATRQAPKMPKARWGQNGDMIFWVESEDERKADEVLGLFSGEE